jgi:N-methylhydantoinase B/oxoprolinase/acetone carboxylase alpha subunit
LSVSTTSPTSSGSSSALTIAWAKGRPGQSTMQYEIMGSAYGGGMGHDGASATATHLSNLHITPIEILESEFPCRITRFEFVPDTGGAGQWRGGLSLLREYELLENATVIRRYDKSRPDRPAVRRLNDILFAERNTIELVEHSLVEGSQMSFVCGLLILVRE